MSLVTKGYGGNSIITKGYGIVSFIKKVIQTMYGGGWGRYSQQQTEDRRRKIRNEDEEIMLLVQAFMEVQFNE